MTEHVVMFSGGVGSWMAARRVADTHGTENLTLLFADTLMEDEDLYRFLDEAAADIGGELVRITEGRTPWQVFNDEKFLGSSRSDPCSKILKRQFMKKWLKANKDPADTIIYFGIDWSEMHRYDRLKERYDKPWMVRAPLCDEPPWLTKQEMQIKLRIRGIKPPRLYDLGFAHNNCGGFCIKAGQGAFVNLLEKMPERYAEHEANEIAWRAKFERNGRPTTILREQRDGVMHNLSLKTLRERVEQGCAIDRLDVGGCGCAVD